jgi:hypothetical protein
MLQEFKLGHYPNFAKFDAIDESLSGSGGVELPPMAPMVQNRQALAARTRRKLLDRAAHEIIDRHKIS